MTNKAPNNLSAESKKLWAAFCADYVDLDSYFFMVLKVCLEAYDRLQEARRLIKKDGITYTTGTGFKRENPALRIEKEARSGFLQAAKMLNLDIEPPADNGRPVG